MARLYSMHASNHAGLPSIGRRPIDSAGHRYQQSIGKGSPSSPGCAFWLDLMITATISQQFSVSAAATSLQVRAEPQPIGLHPRPICPVSRLLTHTRGWPERGRAASCPTAATDSYP